jgi:hypothetical protein
MEAGKSMLKGRARQTPRFLVGKLAVSAIDDVIDFFFLVAFTRSSATDLKHACIIRLEHLKA